MSIKRNIERNIGPLFIAGAALVGAAQSPETVTAPVENAVEIAKNPDQVIHVAEHVGVSAIEGALDFLVPDANSEPPIIYVPGAEFQQPDADSRSLGSHTS